jgi:apolipoprotein N-acyltransferase
MARVRAVEQGVALVRAANTGISALVDPYGRIIRTLGLGQRGVLDGGLPRPLPAPPVYTRWGDGVFWSIVAFLVFITATARKFLAPEGADPKKSHQS